jgi:hypothetical protein
MFNHRSNSKLTVALYISKAVIKSYPLATTSISTNEMFPVHHERISDLAVSITRRLDGCGFMTTAGAVAISSKEGYKLQCASS